MQLGNLMKKAPTTIKAEYPGVPGFYVTLRYVGLGELERAISDKAVVIKGGKVKNIGGFNDTLRQAVSRAIVGWEGLGKEALLALNLDIDVAAVEALPDDFGLECSQDNKEILLKHDGVFLKWAQETCTDIGEMRELELAEQAKNSPPSQAGTPDPEA